MAGEKKKNKLTFQIENFLNTKVENVQKQRTIKASSKMNRTSNRVFGMKNSVLEIEDNMNKKIDVLMVKAGVARRKQSVKIQIPNAVEFESAPARQAVSEMKRH